MCTKVYALMLMLFAVVSVYGQDNVIDEVVWVVGDEAILKSDVENERLNAQYEGRKFDGSYRWDNNERRKRRGRGNDALRCQIPDPVLPANIHGQVHFCRPSCFPASVVGVFRQSPF